MIKVSLKHAIFNLENTNQTVNGTSLLTIRDSSCLLSWYCAAWRLILYVSWKILIAHSHVKMSTMKSEN